MKNTGTLKVTLPSPTEILMTRVFDAPRHLVYEALTRPELLQRWMGPHGHNLIVCEVDLRVGGKWRWVFRDPEGNELGMHGEYLELQPPDRTVHTEHMDGFPGPGAVVTTTLTERDGKTTFEARIRAPSPEVRDAIVSSGMEHGAAESYDRLAELLRG